MSLKIIDCIEWSDPIIQQKDYLILQEKHWQRSNLPPEKNQLRLVLTCKNFNESEGSFWLLYTPALSSLNGLYEYPQEIFDCFIVR